MRFAGNPSTGLPVVAPFSVNILGINNPLRVCCDRCDVT
jgi:hypothetical protein